MLEAHSAVMRGTRMVGWMEMPSVAQSVMLLVAMLEMLTVVSLEKWKVVSLGFRMVVSWEMR